MEQLTGEMNELMSTKMCSPLMIYLAVVVTSALSVYITRINLKKYGTVKMDNLYNLYTLNELKFMIVLGLIIFGLCQYNKSTLAWVFLLFPVVYLLIQNLIIHIHVSSAIQNSPKEVEQDIQQPPQPPIIQQTQQPLGAQVIPQVQQKPTNLDMRPPEMVSTSVSQPLSPGGMSQDFGGVGMNSAGVEPMGVSSGGAYF